MKHFLVFSMTLLLTAGFTSLARAETVVIADAQLASTSEGIYLLSIRSTGPQAFDVLPKDPSKPLELTVRFYQARLGELDALDSSSFGSVSMIQDKENEVLLKVSLSETGYRTKVRQGDSPDTVEIKIAWVPDQTPPVIAEVKVSEVTSTGAKITWVTDELSDAQVVYGVSQPESESSVLDSAQTLQHQVILTGLLPAQQYSFKVRSTDANENTAVSSSVLFTTNTPAFQEAGGLVVMEAENFDQKTARSGKIWTEQTAGKKGDFSGSSYLTALSNSGTTINTQVTTTSPELKYNIDFKTPGIYYIWLRGKAPTAADGSVHAGLNGLAPTSANRITNFISSWRWRSTKFGNTPPTIKVTKAGIHTFHLWMREDGFQIDKILLRTSNSTVAPDNLGPPESPRTA